MTIALLPAGLAVLWVATTWGMAHAASDRSARRGASVILAVSAVASLVATAGLRSLPGVAVGDDVVWLAPGFLGVVPFTLCVVGLVAMGLADSLSHDRDDLRAALAVLAVGMLFVSTDHLFVLSASWLLSATIVWWRLLGRFGKSGVARLFGLFQLTSALLFALAMGGRSVGAGAEHAFLLGACLMAAMGIREAVIPGHSWFVRFVEEAPMALVIAFVAPQLGVYAHVSLLNQGLTSELGRAVAVFGAVTAVLAAALGLAQSSARRGLAYLMMSQTGLVAFGLEGHSAVGFVGSLVAWQVLAIATSGFAMTLSALEARRGRLRLDRFTGCFARTPRMAAGFLTMGLASVGFPLTLGFVAEDLLVQGSIDEFPVLALVLIVATAMNGMNVVRSFFRLFSGRREHAGEADLTAREAWALSVVLLALLLGGLAPSVLMSRELSGHGAGHASAVQPPSMPHAAAKGVSR